MQQIRIGELAVVHSEEQTRSLALDIDATQRSLTQETVVTRERQQSHDARLRQQAGFGATMAVTFLLAHKTDFHLCRRRRVVEVLAVVIATDDLGFEPPWRNRASQLVNVVRSDSFRIVAEHQRAREIQTFSGATRTLIEIMFFL